jgi:hypothetical protein
MKKTLARKKLVTDANTGNPDATLAPPRTQHGATRGKAEKIRRLKYAGFINAGNALFITRNEVRSAVRVRSSALRNRLK